MTWLAWLLLGVGLADLAAVVRPRTPWLAPVTAALAVVAIAGLADVRAPDWVAVAFVVAAVWAWRAVGVGAERSALAARRALAVLVVPGFVLLGLSGWASGVGGPLAQWLAWMDLPGLDGLPAGRLVLLVALGVVNLATANRVVRYVLVSIHARPPRLDAVGPAPASERLRGGRLLGPMERLLILGFGVAGYVPAAALVVAAKGLLRWPELQAAARSASDDVDEVTEYFLIGTFTSLLVALASVVLLAGGPAR